MFYFGFVCFIMALFVFMCYYLFLSSCFDHFRFLLVIESNFAAGFLPFYNIAEARVIRRLIE